MLKLTDDEINRALIQVGKAIGDGRAGDAYHLKKLLVQAQNRLSMYQAKKYSTGSTYGYENETDNVEQHSDSLANSHHHTKMPLAYQLLNGDYNIPVTDMMVDLMDNLIDVTVFVTRTVAFKLGPHRPGSRNFFRNDGVIIERELNIVENKLRNMDVTDGFIYVPLAILEPFDIDDTAPAGRYYANVAYNVTFEITSTFDKFWPKDL